MVRYGPGPYRTVSYRTVRCGATGDKQHVQVHGLDAGCWGPLTIYNDAERVITGEPRWQKLQPKKYKTLDRNRCSAKNAKVNLDSNRWGYCTVLTRHEARSKEATAS
ncbi:unnamed protein product [Ectocarpus fasciculatus]